MKTTHRHPSLLMNTGTRNADIIVDPKATASELVPEINTYKLPLTPSTLFKHNTHTCTIFSPIEAALEYKAPQIETV